MSLSYNLKTLSEDSNKYLSDSYDIVFAHAVQEDHSKLEGTITSFYEIIRKEQEYPDDRKPEIKIDFSCVDGDRTFVCTNDNVGDKDFREIPSYSDINTMTVSIKSIVTKENKIQLTWSKNFDLYQGSWVSLVSNNSNIYVEKADINMMGQTKVIGDKDLVLLRPGKGGFEQVSYCEYTYQDTDELQVSDGEITLVMKSVLKKPVYYKGAFSEEIAWEAPLAARIVK